MGSSPRASASSSLWPFLPLLLLTSSIQAALSDPGLHKTHQGTFQVLVGHLPAPVEGNNSNNQCQQFYLQTADKGIMTLDLPRLLAERLDESELSGSEVEVQFTEDAINGTGSGHQHRKVLHMRRKPAVLHHRLAKSLLVTWPGSTQLGRRTLQQVVSGAGSAPHGPVSMIVFIMDLTKCGTAKPVTTPQVRLFSMIFRYLVCVCVFQSNEAPKGRMRPVPANQTVCKHIISNEIDFASPLFCIPAAHYGLPQQYTTSKPFRLLQHLYDAKGQAEHFGKRVFQYSLPLLWKTGRWNALQHQHV